MRTVYIVETLRGFGKGYSIPEAIKNFETSNHKFRKGDRYTLLTFEAEKMEDVSVDLLNWYTTNSAKFVKEESVTK